MGAAQVNRNGESVTDTDWSLSTSKTVTFAGGTTNAPGDQGGTGNPVSLFTVTGPCLVRIFGLCTTDLAGASATLEVGTALTTAGLIAQTTATSIDANELWYDNSPDVSVALSSVLEESIVTQNIIATVGTADITSGVIQFTCLWYPLTEASTVTAA